jgi:enoyl-CoA hydratase/carnithine racemase
MTNGQYVYVSVEQGVARITIDNPPMNTLNSHTLKALNEVLDQALSDSGVKVMVLTGKGKQAFVAGADITEIHEFAKVRDHQKAQAWMDLSKNTFNKIEQSRKPVIAAVNGLALGGGLELAMSCHIRIASEKARLGQPEINLGIIPAWGGTQRLTRIVGPSKATMMILSGDPISAQEAKAWGLVNLVTPEEQLIPQSVGLARKIAGKSAVVVAAVMDAIGGGLDVSLEQGLALEAEALNRLVDTEDAAEGLAAFMEKRSPQFKDR